MNLRSCAMWLPSALFVAALTATRAASGAPAPAACPAPVVPGQGNDEALFPLREMDMHVHCGMERPIPLEAWIDTAVADGRKVMLVLDHLELYRRTPEQLAAWYAKNSTFPHWYGVGPEGRKALMDDLGALRSRNDIIVFRGWEIYEGDLDRPIEEDALRQADVVGFHISPNNGRRAPDGESFIHRIRQIIELQTRWPMPVILFHPLTMRFENLQRTAQQAGRDVNSITTAEYRFFTPAQQDTVISLLRGRSIYIEIGAGTAHSMDSAATRQALLEDIKPLVDGGVQFTVSTDAHGLRSMQGPFQPETYCEPLGITPRNTNTIVRELLVQRARKAVAAAQQAEPGR